MRIVRGYIARQIARTSGTVLLIMMVAFVLERTLRLTRELDPTHLPLALAAATLAWKIPEILGIALPFAFFAGIVLTFQRLVRDRELDVIYVSGLGLGKLVRPLLLLTLGAAAVSMLVFWFVLPYSRYEVALLMDRAARQALLTAPLQAGSFIQFEDTVLYLEPSRHAADAENIFIYQRDGDSGKALWQGDKAVMTAVAEGFQMSRDEKSLFLSIRDGQRVSLPKSDPRSSVLTFKNTRVQISSAAPGRFRERGTDARELMLPELVAASGQGGASRAALVRAQIHTKLARVCVVFLLPLAAVPLALAFPVAMQWIGLILGAGLVLATDQALIFGETVVGQAGGSPWPAIWGILLAFAGIGAAMLVVVRRVSPWGR